MFDMDSDKFAIYSRFQHFTFHISYFTYNVHSSLFKCTYGTLCKMEWNGKLLLNLHSDTFYQEF